MTTLTQDIIRELLDYDPRTGALTWRVRDRKWFRTEGDWSWWNTKYAGQPAFTWSTPAGHKQGSVLGQKCFAHRIIWLWMTGRWPFPEIDHKNRRPADNRWKNLREVTRSQNNRNQSRYVVRSVVRASKEQNDHGNK